MTIETRVALIQARLEQGFSPVYLEVIDESDKHIGHAGHQGGGRHFAIIIAADALKHISRIDAHRKIYALFTDMIPVEIHALRIVVKE
jgi:BolA protein